jgi:acyl-CoA thioesterase I
MHSLRLILVVLTFLAVAGCTKSPTQAETAQARGTAIAPEPKHSEPDDRPVIVAFGDSLSEGLGVETEWSFPAQLQRKLDSSGFEYQVVNLGVSGDTTTGGLARLGYALSLKPAIVILELGGNDGLRGLPVASTKVNLERMIVSFQKAGTQVLLAGMTLPPNYGADYIRDFEGAYKDLAARYKLQLIPFLMEDIASQIAKRPDLMQRDGIHPTAQGHALIAETVFRYLQPLMKRS